MFICYYIVYVWLDYYSIIDIQISVIIKYIHIIYMTWYYNHNVYLPYFRPTTWIMLVSTSRNIFWWQEMHSVCTCSVRANLRTQSGEIIWVVLHKQLLNFTDILPKITTFGTNFPRPLRGWLMIWQHKWIDWSLLGHVLAFFGRKQHIWPVDRLFPERQNFTIP